MASVASTQSANGIVGFPADFAAYVPQYERVIRRHRVMRWARDRCLDDDLVQSSLLELARVESRYDPSRASSPHHFRLAVLPSRVSDCARILMRMHRDVAIEDLQDCGETMDDGPHLHQQTEKPDDTDGVLDQIIRDQACEVVYENLCALPPRQREVIKLMLDDHTDKEIADRLGVSVQAVNKTRLAGFANLKRHARDKLALN